MCQEKAMAPHSSTLAWKIPWMEEPGRLQSMGSLRVRHDWATSLSRTGEGNGNPLQCSCLENPRDGGAWWAAIYGVAQSWTWLKRLSSSRVCQTNHQKTNIGSTLKIWIEIFQVNNNESHYRLEPSQTQAPEPHNSALHPGSMIYFECIIIFLFFTFLKYRKTVLHY